MQRRVQLKQLVTVDPLLPGEVLRQGMLADECISLLHLPLMPMLLTLHCYRA